MSPNAHGNARPETIDMQAQHGHLPVLLDETIELLRPHSGGRYIDATFGGGGHTRAILQTSAPGGQVLALDADPAAIARAERLRDAFPDRLEVRHGNFAQIGAVATAAGFSAIDGIVMDLGLSSFQLDQPERGFAFRFSGPLDMRFDPAQPVTAADILNDWPEAEITRILFEYGEESKARRIARAIVAERAHGPISSTEQLAAVVERAVGGRRGAAIHPATKTFQALRIAVNRELDALREGLEQALELLRTGGRLAVISFHSLEDRIVKTFFRDEARDCVCPPSVPVCICHHRARVRILTSKPIRPSQSEAELNPRSRSARLRAAERIE